MRERAAHGLGPSHETAQQECGSIARSSRLGAGFIERARHWLLAGAWLIIAGPALGQVAVNDSYSVDEDATLNVSAPGVLGNDIPSSGLLAIQQSSGSNGSAVLNSNGSFSYTPDANFFGTDSFTYFVTDGIGESSLATVTVTVNPVNDPPTTMSDSYAVNEDTTLSRNAAQGVLANDSDIDGNALTASLVSNVGDGSLTLNPNGSFTYTPDENFVGEDSFEYRAVDGVTPNGQNPPVTVTITVNPVNDPPVANPDNYTTPEDQPLSVAAPGVLTNDNDEEDNALTAQLVSQPAAGTGTVTLNANGSFTYTPPLNFFGSASFTYRAVDNGTPPAQSAPPTTVTITVTGVNDPPVANDDSYLVDEDTALSVNAANGVLANDADPDGGTLTAVLDDDVSNGTLQLFANGRFTYTPSTGFSGIDTFTYHADDGTDPSNIATVTITVAEVNDAPIANPDNYSTDEDVALTVNAANGVLANDTDEEGDALTALLVTATTNGTINLNPNGSFTYTPNPNYSGADTFTYRARDNGTPAAQSNPPTTVTITVNPLNDPPIAAADSYTTAEDTTLNVGVGLGVLANDVDADSADVLTAVLVDDVANGTLTLNVDGSLAYTPAADFFGADSFTYLAADNSAAPPGPLQSDTVTVMIDVTPVNDHRGPSRSIPTHRCPIRPRPRVSPTCSI